MKKIKYTLLLFFMFCSTLFGIDFSDKEKEFLKNSPKVVLTKEEQAFIEKHPRILLGADSNWQPFDFRDKNGKHTGFNADYIELLRQKLGINIEVETGKWDELQEKVRTKELAGLVGPSKTAEREKYMAFTRPYMVLAEIVLVQKNSPKINSPKELEGKKLGIKRGNSSMDYIKANFPKINIVLTESEADNIKSLSFGEIDAALSNIGAASVEMRKSFIGNIKIGYEVKELDSDMHFGVRKDWPELTSILQKGMDAISQEEIAYLFSKWIVIASSSDATPSVTLTPQEKRFIDTHPTIRVANDSKWPPFDFHELGKARGYSMDYLRLLAEMIGVNLEFVQDESWEKLVAQFESKKIDVITAHEETPERKNIANFTEPFLVTFESIIIRKDTPFLNNYKDLYGKKVAVIKGYDYEETIKKEYSQIEMISVNDAIEGLKKVSFGEADALVENSSVASYLIKKHGFANLMLAGDPSFPGLEVGDKIRIALRKDWPELHALFVKAMQALPEEKIAELNSRWLGAEAKDENAPSIELTEQELAWLAKNEVIKYAVDPNWMPIEGIDEESKKHEGIIADIIQKISEISGLKLEVVPTKSWGESQELAKSGKAQMLAALSKTEEREKYLNFSEPLLEISSVVVMRGDASFIADIGELTGKKMGVSDGTALHKMLLSKYPKLMVIPIKGVKLALEKLSSNEIDAYLENLEVVGHQINTLGLFNLKVVLKLEEKRKSYSAFVKTAPQEALSIYNKAIKAIPQDDIERIRSKWSGIQTDKKIDYTVILEIMGVAALLAIGMLYWNYLLKTRVKKATSELNILLDAFNHHVIASKSDTRGIITYVSDAFCKISGYTREELIGEAHNIVRHPDMPSETFADLWRTIKDGRVWNGEVKNRKKDGGYYWVDAIIQPDFDEKGKLLGYSAIRQDITATKEVERFNKIAMGREGRIIELKEQVNACFAAKGEAPYYKSMDTECELISAKESALVTAELKLSDVLDLKALQELLDNFCNSVEIASAIIDLEGNILAASRWQRACTGFHRQNAASCANCIESDTDLASKLTDGQEFSIYKCKNGLVDCASPIVVNGKHIANVFIGQFLTEKPDVAYFREQAKKFGYDEQKYVESIHEVPIINEKKLPNILGFLSGFAKMVATLSLDRIKAKQNEEQNLRVRLAALSLAEDAETARLEVLRYQEHLESLVGERTRELEHANEELKTTQSAIEEQRVYLEKVLDTQTNIVISTDGKRLKSTNKAFLEFFHLSTMSDFTAKQDCICDLFEYVQGEEYLQKKMGEQSWVEHIMSHPDNMHKAKIGDSIFVVEATPFVLGDDVHHLAVFTNITFLQQAQIKIKESQEQLKLAYEAGNLGLWDWQIGAGLLLTNDIWYTMLGYEPGIFGDTIEKWSNLVHPQDIEQTFALAQAHMRGETELYHAPHRLKGGNGEWIWIDDIGKVTERDSEGNPTRFIGVHINIDESKRLADALHETHRKISDSIRYASLIQSALLPEYKVMQEFFSESFALWQPKDVVGGDIYLFEQLRSEKEALLMVVDCTGHGVPGAFMTILVKAVERNIIADIMKGEMDVHPAEILQIFNRNIKALLKQDDKDAQSNAGFDGAVLYFDKERKLIRYAGAETPLFYIDKNGELKSIKGDRCGIGYIKSDADYAFTEHELGFSEIDSLFITTDGFLDQNGGEKSLPFGKKRFGAILEANRDEPMHEIKDILLIELGDWQKSEERNDDVSVIGIKV